MRVHLITTIVRDTTQSSCKPWLIFATCSLKGWLRCLLKRLDFKLENVTGVVAACATLHSICEKCGDHCLDEWTQPTPFDADTPVITLPDIVHVFDGADICDAIAKHFSAT